MAIKYIKTKTKAIVVFSNLYTHKEVAEKFGGALSAGFINIDGGNTKCYGESFSLNLKSEEIDSCLAINQFFY